ncbi:nuclear transport factor 2 family protein [Labrys portucalensis]|uniref:Nuclear transport factor 2 family protein n=1 Tax=Labrys neptuniae TaxID=376174 RepID=A0ABV6ZRL1_9HYPH
MTADLERRLRVLEDEAEIHRLAARFSDAVNERDLWAFGRLWADEDAVWSIGPPLTSRAEGRETIVGLLESLYKRERYFMQMTHTGVVTLDGGRATARFVVREHGCGDGTYYENLAVYNDELVRQAEGWRFAKRSYAYRFLSQKPVDEEAFKVTGNHPGEISQ